GVLVSVPLPSPQLKAAEKLPGAAPGFAGSVKVATAPLNSTPCCGAIGSTDTTGFRTHRSSNNSTRSRRGRRREGEREDHCSNHSRTDMAEPPKRSSEARPRREQHFRDLRRVVQRQRARRGRGYGCHLPANTASLSWPGSVKAASPAS